MTVDVELTGFEPTDRPDGSRLLHLPFVGQATGQLFTGKMQPGAADDQIHRNGSMESAKAEYTIRGKDHTGAECSVHVVNRNSEGKWKPTVTTDSKALDFLNGADCTAVLELRLKGPIVHIFTKR